MRRLGELRRFVRKLKHGDPTIELLETFIPADEREAAVGDFVKVRTDFNLDLVYGDAMLSLRAGDVVEVLGHYSFGWWVGRTDSGSVGFFPHHLTFPLYDKRNTARAVRTVLKSGDMGQWNRSKITLVGQKSSGKTSVVRSLLGESFKEDLPPTVGVRVSQCQAFRAPNQEQHQWSRASKRYFKNTVEVALRLVQSKSFKNRNLAQVSPPIPRMEASHSCATGKKAFQGSVKSNDHDEELFTVFSPDRDSDDDEPIGNPRKLSGDSENTESLPAVMRTAQIKSAFKGDLIRLANDQSDRVFYSVWDFSGKESYSQLHPLFLANAGVYIITFDVTKIELPSEIAALRHWLETCKLYAPSSSIILVGTHVNDITSLKELHVVEYILRRVLTQKEYDGERRRSVGSMRMRLKRSSTALNTRLKMTLARKSNSSKHNSAGIRISNSHMSKNSKNGSKNIRSSSLSGNRSSFRLSRNMLTRGSRVSSVISITRPSRNIIRNMPDLPLLYNVQRNINADLLFFPVDSKEDVGFEDLKTVIHATTEASTMFKKKISLRWLRCLDQILQVTQSMEEDLNVANSVPEFDNLHTVDENNTIGENNNFDGQNQSVFSTIISRQRAADAESFLPDNAYANVIGRQTLERIAGEIGIVDGFEMEEMLEYFHACGLISYYGNISHLSRFVSTDPQWLADNISRLILLTEKSIPKRDDFEGFKEIEKLIDFGSLHRHGLDGDFKQLLSKKIVSFDLLEFLWGRKDVEFLTNLAKSTMMLSDWEFPRKDVIASPDAGRHTGKSQILDFLSNKVKRDALYFLPSFLHSKAHINLGGPEFEMHFTCVLDFSELHLPPDLFPNLICLMVSASQFQNNQLRQQLQQKKFEDTGALLEFLEDIEEQVNKTPILYKNYAKIYFNDGSLNSLLHKRKDTSPETVFSKGYTSIRARNGKNYLSVISDQVILEECVTFVRDENQILMFTPKSSYYAPSKNLSRVVSMLHKIEKELFYNYKLKYKIGLETFKGQFISYEEAAVEKTEPWFNSFIEYGDPTTSENDLFDRL